jgi:hypothetical protein
MAISSQVYLEIPPLEGETLTTFIELTVTSSVAIEMPTEISSFPTLDGATISDNAVNGNKVYQLEGVISDTLNSALSSGGKQKLARDNFKLLQYVRDSHKRFTLYFDNNQDPVSDCMLTKLTFTKGSAMGSSYEVSLGISEILVSKESLSSIEQFISEESKDQLDGATKTNLVSTESVLTETIIARGGTVIVSQLSDLARDAALRLTEENEGE